MASTMTEYRRRRKKILEYLGSKCADCGKTSTLQVDHTDHLTKGFDISKNWSRSWDILEPELDKCQLLCKKCHLSKSKDEGSLNKNKPVGSRVKGSKLTDGKVIDIKQKLSIGQSMVKLSREYQVSYGAIKQIKYGITWKHI